MIAKPDFGGTERAGHGIKETLRPENRDDGRSTVEARFYRGIVDNRGLHCPPPTLGAYAPVAFHQFKYIDAFLAFAKKQSFRK